MLASAFIPICTIIEDTNIDDLDGKEAAGKKQGLLEKFAALQIENMKLKIEIVELKKELYETKNELQDKDEVLAYLKQKMSAEKYQEKGNDSDYVELD